MPPEPDAPAVAVTGEVVVTEADVSRGLAQLPLVRRRWSYLIGSLLLVAFFAAGGTASLANLIPFLLIAGAFQAYLFLTPWIMAKRTLAAMPDRLVRYRATPDEITIATTGSTVTRRWDRITRANEDKTAFLIWVGPYAVQVIPKRAFKQEDLPWLRETLARKSAAGKGLIAARARPVVLWVLLVIAFLALWQFLQMTAPSATSKAPAQSSALPAARAP